jgi:starch phosphorylase
LDLTHNPWIVLQTASEEKLQSVTTDPHFQLLVADLRTEKLTIERSQGWFQRAHPRSGLTAVAYFSMEFMLSEALPIYSGGLGNVAGDQLKAASNLSVPVKGIGLLYQQGYFRQEIDAHGQQVALYPFNDPGQLPIRPLRKANREWLRLPVDLSGSRLWIRVWEAKVGRANLYLLDTNDPANIKHLLFFCSRKAAAAALIGTRLAFVLSSYSAMVSPCCFAATMLSILLSSSTASSKVSGLSGHQLCFPSPVV